MPEILTRIHMAILTKGRAIEERLDPGYPSLAAICSQHMGGLRAKFEQEASKTEAEIRITIDGKLFAVNVSARVRDMCDGAD